jgi:hypothetical protein
MLKRVTEDRGDGEKLEKPMSSSGLKWADDDDLTVLTTIL